METAKVSDAISENCVVDLHDPVGGHEGRRLAGDEAADIFEALEHLLVAQVHAEPWRIVNATVDNKSTLADHGMWANFRAIPGIDSSLSSVPPVKLSPRPDTMGTFMPQAASAGAKTCGFSKH